MDAPVKALNTEKAKALQAALAQIEKQFGKGSIMRLGDGEAIEDIQVVSTGSLGLDVALGVGGLPRGRVVEIYGPESSGKTTLTLQVIAEMQKQGGQCAFVDGVERARGLELAGIHQHLDVSLAHGLHRCIHHYLAVADEHHVGQDVLDFLHLMGGDEDGLFLVEIVLQQALVELLAVQDV